MPTIESGVTQQFRFYTARRGSVAVYTWWSHLEFLHYKPGSVIAPTAPTGKRQHFLNHTKALTVVSFPIFCFGILESVELTGMVLRVTTLGYSLPLRPPLHIKIGANTGVF